MDDRQAKIVISADTSNYTSSVNESYEATNRLNTSLAQTQKSMDSIVARAGKKLALFGAADLTALSSAVTVAATLDKQMSTLNATAVNLGKTTAKTFKTDMRDGIRAISREIPVARGEIVQLATTITKMGQTSGKTITALTKSFAEMGAATGDSPFALAQSQLGLSRTMGTFTGAPGTNGPKIVQNFNDSVTSLAAQGGVNAQSILDFAQMLAPTARMANISQTDLLGISTAFNRSGADGTYAANTFNQLVTDLTERRITGDPRLRTFQNQLGLSDKELKNADPVEIFSKLVGTVGQQGERGVVTLDALGLGGIRNRRSIQSLAAEGNVDKYIDIAREEYGSGSTKRGADEAFGGLFDSMEKVKNNFLDLGQAVGQELLPVVDKFAKMFASVTEKVVGALQPLLKLTAPLMTGVGGAALAGAGMLGVWAKMGPIAMARWGMNTRPGLGLKEGFRMGKVGGDLSRMSPEQIAYATAISKGSDGPIGPVSRLGYAAGGYLGAARAWMNQVSGGQGGFLRQGVAGIGAVGRWLGDQTRQFYYQSTAESGYAKLRPDQGRRGFLASFGGALRGGVADTAFGRVNAEDLAKTRAYNAGPGLWTAVRTNMADAANAKTMKVMATEAGRAAVSLGKVAWSANRAAMSLTGSIAGLAVRGTGRGLAAIGGGIMNLAGGPTGLAIMGTLAAGYAGKSLYDSQKRKEINLAEDENISQGMTAYNEKLGIATTALTTFKDALDAATGNLNKKTTFAGISKDTSLKQEAQKEKEYTDKGASTLNNDADAQAWLRSKGKITTDQYREMAIDLYRRQEEGANINVEQVLKNYNRYRKSGKIDLGPGGESLQGAMLQAPSEGGLWDQFYRQILGPMGANAFQPTMVGVRRSQMNLYDTEGMRQATQSEVNRTQNLMSQAQNKYGGTKKGAIEVDRQVRGDAYATLARLAASGTPEGLKAAQMYADALRATGDFKGAKEFDFATLETQGKTAEEIAKELVDKRVIGKLDMNYVQSFIESNVKSVIGESGLSVATRTFLGNKDFKGIPGFKEYAKETGESDLLARAELRSNDPNLQWRAIQKQRKAASNASGGNLLQNDVLYDTTLAQYVEGPRADAARAAQELDRKERAFQTQFLNRPSQVGQAISEWQTTMKSPDSTTGIGQKRFAAAENAKQAIADLYMTLQQYDRQMEREEEDFYQNRAWSMEDFYRGRRQSTEAYHRQMAYSEQEFNIQRKRSNDEYQRSVRRSTADHHRELLREEKSYEMQRQWSISDYNRSKSRSEFDYQRQVRLQWRDFNISRQRAEEDYAKQRKRSDFDFNLSRQRGYRDFGISMQRSQDDYQRQLLYGEQDYQKSRQRATDDFNLSLSRSYEDYNKSRIREEEDHNIQLIRMSKDAAKQFYDPWLRVQSQATAGVDTFVENLRDQTERIQRQFENLKKLRSRGLSQDAIDMFGLSDPTKAQQLQRLTVEMTDKQIAEINRLTKEREKSTQKLTQSDFSEQFRRMEEDRQKSLKRGEEDFKLSVERSIADFKKSMTRMAEDYNLSLIRSAEQFTLSQERAVEDFNKSMKDSAEDYARSLERSDEDFALSMKRATEDFLRSMEDSEYSYRLSMERGDEDFERSLERQDQLRKIALNQAARDWERMLERQARDYARSVRNMIKDHDRAVNHSNKEFQISMDIANENFKRQLQRADISRDKMLKRSRQDLIGFGKQVFGDYGDIMTRLTGLLRKHMGAAGNSLITKLKDVEDKLFDFKKNVGNSVETAFTKHVDHLMTKMDKMVARAVKHAETLARKFKSAFAGVKVSGSSQTSSSGYTYTPGEGYKYTPPGRALGGVATGDTITRIGEGGPELILPLNSRGMDYLTTALRQYAQTDAMRLRGTQSMFYQQPSQGNITQFNFGDVSVASDTPDQFYREMKQKESLKKLVGH